MSQVTVVSKVYDIFQQPKTMNLLEKSSPHGVDPTKVMATVCDLVRRDSWLQGATPHSIVASVIEGTQLGLSFSRPLGHAYLVRYGTTATLIVGYKGLCKLAYNSGQVQAVEVGVVYDGEEFECVKGNQPVLRHVPKPPNERGEDYAYWCQVWLKNGMSVFNTIYKDEAWKVARRNPKWEKTPWKTDFIPMAQKTALRRMAKYLPLSEQVQEQLGREDHNDLVEAEPIDLTTNYFPEAAKEDHHAAEQMESEFSGDEMSQSEADQILQEMQSQSYGG